MTLSGGLRMQPEPVPFVSERTQALRKRVKTLAEITPVLGCPQLVRGWLTAGGLSVVYGPSNCGKTFFVADLAMHVAAGVPWRGNRVKPGAVVYVAAEGGRVIGNRFEAIRQAKPELCQHNRFHLLASPVDLSGGEDATALCQLLPDTPLALVVIDTLARSIGDGDENSAKDVSGFVQNLDQIRDQTGAHVLVVHHSGKDAERGARGSSALRAAVDTEIAIDAQRRATAPKQRDLPIADPLFFDLQQVTLGQDNDGEPVTSAIVVDADAPTMKQKRLSGRAEVALQALEDALMAHGQPGFGPDLPAGRTVVKLEIWREQIAIHGLTDGKGDSAERMAMKRARDSLLEANQIRIHGDFVWKVFADE